MEEEKGRKGRREGYRWGGGGEVSQVRDKPAGYKNERKSKQA